jgi:hypothetical protein
VWAIAFGSFVVGIHRQRRSSLRLLDLAVALIGGCDWTHHRAIRRRGSVAGSDSPARRAHKKRSTAVKYVALVYSNPGAFEALSQSERDELMSLADAYLKDFTETGELLGGAALADPSTSRTVRVRNGVPAVTDGPFAEAKEQLAGYYLLDVESIERATEIVTNDPAARFWAVEVRPIMDAAGAEM